MNGRRESGARSGRNFSRGLKWRAKIAAWLGLTTVLAGASAAHAGWLERDHSIFFPEGSRANISAYQTFPVFWWDFLVVRGADDEALNSLCDGLKVKRQWISRAECNPNLNELTAFIQDWARDLPLREPRPSDARLRGAMESSLAQATLPTGSRDLLQVLRADPLESWRDLQALAEKRLPMKLARVRGFFRDEATGNVVIPLQLAHAPPETGWTRELREWMDDPARKLPTGQAWLLGPHFSTLENEEQIMADMHRATALGGLILLALAVAIVAARRWRLALLIPVVLISVAVSTLATILLFGSIHGLTLAFGPGVVGLALDYGLHGAVRMQFRRTWTANLFGMLTTIAGLAILMTSQIPLLRQLMAFSAMGMAVAFALYFLALRAYPRVFLVEPFHLRTRARAWTTAVVVALVAAALTFPFLIHPDFDMRSLDFQEPAAREVSGWLFRRMELKPPLFTIHDQESGSANGGALARSQEEKAWALANHLNAETLANYLPAETSQRANAASWQAEPCAPFVAKLSDAERRFFKPFIDGELCRSEPRHSQPWGERTASYLRHLGAPGLWLTLWLPNSDEEEAKVRARYPQASSLRDVALVFPRELDRELRWMVPLSLSLALGLMLVYFRGKLGFTLLAMLPFLTGLGLVALANLVFGLALSFIGLIALVMVFGFSLDYGIFAADLMRYPDPHSEEAVWTATLLSATATITGFVPLLFCRHPVLRQLGGTLFLGAIGTYFGTKWGIPGAMEVARAWRGRHHRTTGKRPPT